MGVCRVVTIALLVVLCGSVVQANGRRDELVLTEPVAVVPVDDDVVEFMEPIPVVPIASSFLQSAKPKIYGTAHHDYKSTKYKFACKPKHRCPVKNGVCCRGGKFCCPMQCIDAPASRKGVKCTLSKKLRTRKKLFVMKEVKAKLKKQHAIIKRRSWRLKRQQKRLQRKLRKNLKKGNKFRDETYPVGKSKKRKKGNKKTHKPLSKLRLSRRKAWRLVHRLKKMTDLKKTCNRLMSGYMHCGRNAKCVGSMRDEERGIGKASQPGLNVTKVVHDVRALGAIKGVHVSTVDHVDGGPILKVVIPTVNKNRQVPRVLITSGVHGNEPQGPVSVLQLMALILDSIDMRDRYSFTIFPMLNLGGLRDNMRTTRSNKDLNRKFVPGKKSVFPRHMRHLRKFLSQKANTFDLAVDVHGAIGKHGFYIIRASAREFALARDAITVIPKKLRQKSPTNKYPGWIGVGADKKRYLFTEPGVAKSVNHNTLKGFMHDKHALAYTLEYPGQVPVCTRQVGLVTLTFALINKLDAHLQH